MERETRYTKERMETEHGQYFEFVAEAEFYAIDQSDTEEVAESKKEELKRIRKALVAQSIVDLKGQYSGPVEDPLTKRLVQSKFNELQTDFYFADATIQSFMNNNLFHFIADDALIAFRHGEKRRDLELFAVNFINWMDYVEQGHITSWMGKHDYQETLQIADEMLEKLKADPHGNEELIQQLADAIEFLASFGKFPENVREMILDKDLYGIFHPYVKDASEYRIYDDDSEEIREAKKEKLVGYVREVNAAATAEIAESKDDDDSRYIRRVARSDQFYALSHIYEYMYGPGNGLSLSFIEQSLYAKYSKQKTLLFLENLESWVERMVEGKGNVIRNHQTVVGWLREIKQDIDAINSDEWRKDNRMSKEFCDSVTVRMQKVYDVLALYREFPENILVTNNLSDAKKHLTQTN